MDHKKNINPKGLLQIERHLNLIRRKLWEGQEHGRAAVLIGAGFSQNAVKRSPNTSPMPLWKDLGKSMYEELYPNQTPPNNIEALKIAEQFESTFGKQVSKEFFIKRISDEDYFPSKLHKLLLYLPWSDIFTTNYDTLIERTRRYIYGRKYDLVKQVDEIPFKSKPRIIKLHGTAPSFKPFIISEEDYRTYPTKFAPFVNIVQESIMENTFCLLGFSGNDPNFLKWAGWVRDNLGDSMPPIYLIGMLDIPEPQQKVYESRNIIPIDLSGLFPKSDYPDEDLRHYRATEWFLWYLAKGSPCIASSWPNTVFTSVPLEQSKDLPEVPVPKTSSLKSKMLHPKNTKNNLEIKDELMKLYKEWKVERESYPGWIVLPMENRNELWEYTEYWLEYIKYIEELETPYDLFMLYELNWRIEKLLLPLLSNWLDMYKRIIEKYNPFPSLIMIQDSQVLPIKERYINLDWPSISKQWIELSFALVRDARESLDKDEFNLLMERIHPVIEHNKEWKSRWYYEKAMFSLLSLDLNEIIKTIEKWPEDFEVPYWELKRVSILTEIGELKKAEKIGEEVLEKVRILQQPGKVDYHLLSLEGWTMLLLDRIRMPKKALKGDDYNKGRLYKLNAYRCNPYNEIEPLKSKLTEDKPPIEPSNKTKKAFDPGITTTTTHFYGSPYSVLKVISPAFNFLRMLEDGAVPLRCGIVYMWSKPVINASKWLRFFYPSVSISSLLRTGESEEAVVDKFFSRIAIATLEENELKRLTNIFIPAWKQSIKNIESFSKVKINNYSFPVITFKMLSEIISRLCFRLQKEQIDDIYKIVVHLYLSPVFFQNNSFYSDITKLFKRILYSMPNEEILQKLPELLSLSVAGEDFQLPNNIVSQFPEPFNYINNLVISNRMLKKLDTPQWHASIEKLINVVKNSKTEARKRAILRLSKLYDNALLTDEETKEFGEALWYKLDSKSELPENTGLYNWKLLFLPESKVEKGKKNFKKYLLQHFIPPLNGIPNTPLNDFLDSLIHSTKPLILKKPAMKNKYIDWNVEEINTLFEKIISWWDSEKDKVKKYLTIGGLSGNEIRNYIHGIFYVFNQVIFPNLELSKSDFKKIYSFFKDVENLGFYPWSFLPGFLFLDSNKYETIKEMIKEGLVSPNREEALSAIMGINFWTFYTATFPNIPKISKELVGELISKISFRQQPELDLAIKVLIAMIGTVPDMLQEEQVKNINTALKILLEDTNLPKKPDLLELKMEEYSRAISIDEITTYRELSSHLTFALKNWYIRKRKSIPEIIQKCERTYTSDYLPEVRKVWH